MQHRTAKHGLRLEELDQIFRHAPVGFCVLDSDLRFSYVNEPLAAVSGLPVEEHPGRRIDGILPELAARIQDRLGDLREPSGAACEVAITGCAPGEPDRKREWRATLVPLRSAHGKLRAIAVTVQGLSEAPAEASLRQAELPRRFLEAVPVGVITWTWDGAIREANDCFLRMVGYSREDLLAGRIRWSDLTPEEFRQRDQEALAELQATGANAPYEKAYRRKDGSLVPILLSCVMLDAGRNREGTGFALDLSELKRTERALRENEQRLRFHVENTSLGLVEFDAGFVITRWSDEAARIFGWTAAEAVGRPSAELRLVHDEDETLTQQVIARLTDGVTRRVVCANRNWTKNGRIVHCEWHNSVLLDEQGRISSVMSLVQDCTARIEAEQALAKAKQAAEAANLVKRQFLASLNHEMRTPLTAIVGYAELLDRPGLSKQAQRQHLDTIQRNAQTLLRLVDHVLDWSKIESGKMVLEGADCSLWQIIRDVLSATGARAEQKGLTQEVAYEYPLPEQIRTDPLRLYQILLNLVDNAVKFTEHGGVRIRVQLEPSGEGGNRRLRFTVSDTGIGIRPEWQERLFEPFAQDGGRSVRDGFGLGLPIAAKLAELLGTRIEMAPQAGPGAAFTFALDPGPLEGRRMLQAAPPEGAGEIAVADPARIAVRGRVLVTEDAPDNRELLRLHLQSAGLQVDVADDGLEAVQQALAAASAGRSYDVILMDLEMPKLDGYAALRLLRASAWRGAVVVLTAHTTVEDQQRCREAGFDGYLAKPVTSATLLATVRNCLEARKRAADSGGPGEGGAAGGDLAQALTDEREEARLAQVTGRFTALLPERLERLEHCLAQRDRRGLAQAAHQLAGSAGQFGFPELAAAAQRLEQGLARGWDKRGLVQRLNAVRAAAATSRTGSEGSVAETPPAAPEGGRCRVLLVDDDELVRAALRILIDGLAGFQVVGEAVDGQTAIEQTQACRPEIILLDIAMPELDGLNAMARIAAVNPSVKFLILSAFVGDETVAQALRAGASGYLLKSVSPAELERALAAAARGEAYFCPAAAKYLATQAAEDAAAAGPQPKHHLTPRQLEVLKRIAEGDSSKMIARKLRISVRTAEHHRTNLMQMLGIHDTASLVRYAIQMGLVTTNR